MGPVRTTIFQSPAFASLATRLAPAGGSDWNCGMSFPPHAPPASAAARSRAVLDLRIFAFMRMPFRSEMECIQKAGVDRRRLADVPPAHDPRPFDLQRKVRWMRNAVQDRGLDPREVH